MLVDLELGPTDLVPLAATVLKPGGANRILLVCWSIESLFGSTEHTDSFNGRGRIRIQNDPARKGCVDLPHPPPVVECFIVDPINNIDPGVPNALEKRCLVARRVQNKGLAYHLQLGGSGLLIDQNGFI